MSRYPSTDLFELVKALTPSEKRSFRIRAGAEGDPLYLRLYAAIEKMDAYNEAKILKRVSDIKPGQLSNLKAYLYDLLLGHLHDLYAGKEERTALYDAVSRADVLYDKGLYSQCSELLKKLKEICRKKDNTVLGLAVIEREINLVKKSHQQWHLLEEKYKEKRELMAYMARTDSYRYVRDMIGTFVSKVGTARTEEERKQMLALKQMLPDDSEITSDNERQIYHNVMYRYCFAMREHAKAHDHIKKVVVLCENDGDKSIFNYLLYLANYTGLCIRLKKYSEAKEAIEKIKNTRTFTTREAQRARDYYYVYSIAYHNATGRFARSIELLQEFIAQPGTDVITGLSIAFDAATAYFCLGDLHNALKRINPVINHPKTPALWHIQCLARVLNLLVHYELGNDVLLAYNLRSTYRYLMHKGFLDAFERVILEFVRMFCRYVEPGEEKKLLKEMQVKLTRTIEEAEENSFEHSHFNITLALRSRLEKRSVAEILNDR